MAHLIELEAQALDPAPSVWPTKKPAVYLCVHDFGVCGWYRMHVPGVGLQLKGYEVCLDDHVPTDALREFDVFVFQRRHEPEILERVRQVKAMGKRTVAELDDDFWHLPTSNPYYARYHEDGGERLTGTEAIIRECDAVTVSTPPLAEVVRPMNPNVYVLPNMLPSSYWRVEHEPRADGTLVIGWAGTPTHDNDLALLRGTVERVLDEHPQVELHMAGMFPKWLEGLERVHELPARQIERYPNVIAAFDIGLAPLVDTQFNRCKSDLKFVEYGMVGVPAVLSDVEPYARTVKHSENGFLARKPKDWLKALRLLIDDTETRVRVAHAAREYARTRTIERNIHLWEEAYGLA